MFCRSCGERNDESARFCTGCGRRLENGESVPTKRKHTVAIVLSILLAAGGGFGVQQYLAKEAEADTIIVHNSKEQAEPVQREKKEIIKAAQKKVYTIVTDTGIGSGFLFTKDGMVVTNAHVVAGFTDVTVRNSDGEEVSGRVIGISDVEDIAIIEVDAYKGQEPLPAEMKVTEVGSEVIALGSPNGFENSASIGYLTGVDRDISFDFEYEDIYQIDAQIAPGSSGGPLVDAETGNVIGINSLLYNDGNAIGFSIPLHSVHDSLMGWVNDPMSAAAVASVFGVYDSYDYFDWLEDYDYESEPVYEAETDTETVYEEEEIEVPEETFDYEEESYEEEYTEEFSEEEYTEESTEEYEEEYVEEFEEETVEEEYEEPAEEVAAIFDETSVSNYVSDYRSSYEMALESEDFSYVADMLLPGSAIYSGISGYIDEIRGQGMVFDFIDQSVLGVEIYDDYALVHAYESFDFMDASGVWTFEERNKTYTVVADETGAYWISDIATD